MTDQALLEAAAAWLDAGRGVALATVLRTWGSAPRPAGSHLVVDDQGAFLGSVSGGCVEAAVVEAAQQAIRSGAPASLSFGVTQERAWEVGLACGGTIEVAVAPLADRAVLGALLSDLEARRPVVAAHDLATGAVRLLRPEDPASPADPLLGAAGEALRRGRSAHAGEGTFLRVHAPPVRLVLVGAVHIAQALAPMAALAGCQPVVVDPRPAFASAARFPGVEVIAAWPEVALPRLGLDRHTALVALSHDPRIDEPALARALGAGCFYVGALGSRRTHAARVGRLAALGLPQEALARLRGPVGLDVGAESPGEIAAAILAELVLHLRRPAGG